MKKSLFFTTLASGILMCSAASAQSVKLYSTSKSYQKIGTESLRTRGKEALSFFRKKATYYGAFVANIEEDTAGRSWGHHSLDEAIFYAEKGCKVRAKNDSGCKLYAVVIPRGFTHTSGEIGLNQDATKDYTQGDLATGLKEDKYAALAVNGLWNFGWATNNVSLDAAREDALNWCQQGADRDKETSHEFFLTKIVRPKDWKCSIRFVVDNTK